jgi:hypothetical protein
MDSRFHGNDNGGRLQTCPLNVRERQRRQVFPSTLRLLRNVRNDGGEKAAEYRLSPVWR